MAAKIKLNRDTLVAQLKSRGTQNALDAQARRIAANAGDGNVARSGTGRTRGRAAVVSYKGKHSLDALKRAAGR